MANVGDCIEIPVLYGPTGNGHGTTRCLGSVNCEPNGITYAYCAEYCCTSNDHCGHDVGAYTGENMYAVTDGYVDFSGSDGYYCPVHVNIVPSIGPYKNELHIYGHMQSVAVSAGTHVVRGQKIGTQGDPANCGWCGGDPCPHCHFERRDTNNCSADPTPVLTAANANGGATPPPPPPPTPTSFKYGDMPKALDTLNVRATPAGAVIGSMPAGMTAEVLSEASVTASLGGTSYVWVYLNLLGKNLKGWVATASLGMFRPNRILNPQIPNNTNNIIEYHGPGVTKGVTSSSRNLVSTGGASVSYTDYWLTVSTDGSRGFQGVYFRSEDINTTGTYKTARGFISLRNISSSDFIKYVGIRLIYDTGSPTDKWHTSQPTGSAEQRIGIPAFAVDPNRKLVRAQWYLFGANDNNPRSWQANRAIVYLEK